MLSKNMKSKPTIRCDRHGRSYSSAVCEHLCHETGLRYLAIKFPPNHPGVWQAWCEKCHAVLEEEGGWTNRAIDFAGMLYVCTSCYKKTLRRHKRLEPHFMELNERNDNMQLTLGCWEQEIVAALAYDLAARAMGHKSSEYNFSDEMLRDLVPIYDDDLVKGLSKRLPKRLRKAIVRQVRWLSSEQVEHMAMTFDSAETMAPASVVQRLEQFFQVANLRCANCSAWHGDPEEFGIKDEAEWDARMSAEMIWMRDNTDAVLKALPSLEREWSECCAVVQELLCRNGTSKN